jgi:hypothetical protein
LKFKQSYLESTPEETQKMSHKIALRMKVRPILN